MDAINSFKTIPGFPNYAISRDGYVKNIRTGRILKNYLSRKYYNVCLSNNGIRHSINIHILMAITYLNHKPDGHKIVVDHINNNPLDNRLDNLQLISHRSNLSKDRERPLLTGVSLSRNGRKYSSKIQINGKVFYLGMFNTELEAYQAYLNMIPE
jgi:hypothetical protein